MIGVLIVDKPRGPTSFDVVAAVRRATGERRVGHAGTLDPMASGVLPVCLGEACKLVPYLMADEKVYQAEVRLGVTTDTLDAEGRVTDERPAGHLSAADVERALAGLRGRILQVPPMHSALRVGGRRLYEHARAGQTVERRAREVEIHELVLESFAVDGAIAQARLTVRCGKGTYIRSLAADLGERLGVGAHLGALRRTRVGRFEVAEALPLERLAGARPLTPAEALAGLPALQLDALQARHVRDGQQAAIAALARPPSPSMTGTLRLLRPDGTLLALAEAADGQLRLLRVFS
jgi:tRNA pseudouridine55 synthase